MQRDRKSVLMVLYDLPVLTAQQRRCAQLFRRQLIAAGYLPVQKSVYVKLLHNDSSTEAEISRIKKAVPESGTVHVLAMSSEVFGGLRSLCGKAFNKNVFADDLFVL